MIKVQINWFVQHIGYLLIQKKRFCEHFSVKKLILGSLSEAQQVFDAALLEKVIAELARRLPAPALPTGLFAVFKANPVAVSVTADTGSERTALRHFMQPGGFYVFDRGYTDYALFQNAA